MKLRLRVVSHKLVDASREAIEFAPVREQHDGPADKAPIALDGKDILTADDRIALDIGVDRLRTFVDARLSAGLGALAGAFPGEGAKMLAQLPAELTGALMTIVRAVLDGAVRDVASDVAAGALANELTMAFAVHDAKGLGVVKAGVTYDVEFTEVA